MYKMVKIDRIFFMGLAILTSAVLADELDQPLLTQSYDAKVTSRGGVLFQQACASCHARDLSGASGFNLKDGEWIHGGQPKQILSNIKKGFANAGMPGFGAVYSEQDLQSIVAYVLSKREGFDGLTFKIYQMKDSEDKVIQDSKLIKQGELTSNVADFRLPEVEDYTIEFAGDFYAPRDIDSKLWIQWGKPLDVHIEVNGHKVLREGEWDPTWKLARGKQSLKISYHSGDNKPNQRNLALIVTNSDRSIKLFPVSTKAKFIMSDIKVEVIAADKTVVQRKKILNIPAYSISVGLPAKLNYAFNTRLCAVVGLWQGDMLNVGPNVSGRGQDGSLALGDWAFRHPDAIKHIASKDAKCHYKGYKFENKEPVFSYQFDGVDYSLKAEASTANEIRFVYKTYNLTQSHLALNLPQVDGVTWQTAEGEVKQSDVRIEADAQNTFMVSARISQ